MEDQNQGLTYSEQRSLEASKELEKPNTRLKAKSVCNRIGKTIGVSGEDLTLLDVLSRIKLMDLLDCILDDF